MPFIAGSVYDSGRIYTHQKQVEEAVLYSNIFRIICTYTFFIDTSVGYYRGSRTERLMNFIQRFDDIVETIQKIGIVNNLKYWIL